MTVGPISARPTDQGCGGTESSSSSSRESEESLYVATGPRCSCLNARTRPPSALSLTHRRERLPSIDRSLFYQEQRDAQRNRADELTTQLVDAEARIALLEDELSSAQSSSAPSTRLAAQMAEALEAFRSMSERNRVLAVDLSMAKADVASSQELSAGLQSELDQH